MLKRIGILLGALLILSGCDAAPQNPSEAVPDQQEAMDPLAEARRKLFEEIGIDETDPDELAAEESDLPVVLPTPPELPKTDADLTE